MKIFSKIHPQILVASCVLNKDISDYRNDLSPAEEFLQVSARNLKLGIKVNAHKHNPQHRKADLTQEAWIIISGKLKAVLYDLDDSFLAEITMGAGDCIVLFRGGHSLEVLEDDTKFYEFKNGPYNGIESDKQPINQ